MTVYFERIDDITFARADARGVTFARRTQDCALAFELLPAAQLGLYDYKVFVRNPVLRLRSDDPTKIPLGRLKLAQPKLRVGKTKLSIHAPGVLLKISTIEILRPSVVLRGEFLSRSRKISLRRR